MTSRPPLVTRAVMLVYAGIIMAAISNYYNYDFAHQLAMSQLAAVQDPSSTTQPAMSSSALTITTIVLTAIGLAFYAWLTYKILKGRNWARLVFLILVLFNLVMMIKYSSFQLQLYHHSVVGFVLSLLPLICNLAALVLLFFTSGSKWFSKKSV